jgi:hypothetical protein
MSGGPQPIVRFARRVDFSRRLRTRHGGLHGSAHTRNRCEVNAALHAETAMVSEGAHETGTACVDAKQWPHLQLVAARNLCCGSHAFRARDD